MAYGSLAALVLWQGITSIICYKANAVSELAAIKRVKRAGHKANVVSEPYAFSGVPTLPSAPLYYQKEEVSHGY
jgi:hypothetical protein